MAILVTAKMSQGINQDEFLFRLIEGGHTAIFQWIAVYAASGIGLIQMTNELLKSPEIGFQLIYVGLMMLMTILAWTIFSVMHHQNEWAENLSSLTQKNCFTKVGIG